MNQNILDINHRTPHVHVAGSDCNLTSLFRQALPQLVTAVTQSIVLVGKPQMISREQRSA